MNHLLIIAHPIKTSFNYEILRTIKNSLEEKNCNVVVRDLYEINFNPVITGEELIATYKGDEISKDILIEQEYIRNADIITFIYPVWWSSMPSILKGYFDRVFSFGFAYSHDENGDIKLLLGKKGIFINTHGENYEKYKSSGMIDALYKTTSEGILGFVGISPIDHIFTDCVSTTDEKRKEFLENLKIKYQNLV